MVGGGGNKIVATLRADGKVFPTKDGTTTIAQLANLMNYKIRTEGEINRSLSTLSVPTTVVDLGKQLLQYARDSDLKGVKNALSRGAPFTSDWLGMSALHFAAMNNQLEICQVLLNGGINKDSKTKVDRTPLHLACYYGNEKIVELLLSKNCAVNPRDMLRMTPLHWAVEKRHKSIVRLLLKHNADVTLVTKFGRTPLALAVITEQADLLEELEAARQSQASRKYNEEHEKKKFKSCKETSEAVNSIMGLTSDVIDEPESIRKIDHDDDFTSQSEYAAAKIQDLENIKETGILGDSTINLLKSHGISMMPDDDTSKDMLNTALQNGRQLILSEGGKLLLNETKKINNNNNNNNNNNSSNNNNLNNTKTIVPVRVRNDSSTYGNSSSANNTHAINKLKPNIISKAKDNANIGKNKNIRIISLNDFKKLYGNTNIKAMQKLPQTLASQRLVNVRQHGQSKIHQIKIDTKTNKITTNADDLDDDENISHIIQIETKDNDADTSESEYQIQHVVQQSTPQHHHQQHPQQQQQTLIKQQPSVAKQPVRIIPAKRVEHMGTVQVRQMPTHNIKVNSNSNANNQEARTYTKTTTTTTANSNNSSSSSVIPLLSTPEICRQLLELRKQNEELKRKFDLAQKEKDDLKQRLERLEELLLVERTDEDS